MSVFYEISDSGNGIWDIKTFENSTFKSGASYQKGTAVLSVDLTNTKIEISEGENMPNKIYSIPNSQITVPVSSDAEDLYNNLSAIVNESV